jgi:UDPglucose 6-dehydrogenase
VKKNVKGKKIAAWGLAFKPNTDDIRFAPSLYIIKDLLKAGFEITAYDPAAAKNVKRELGDSISYSEDIYEMVRGADALLIFTEWNEFMQADLDRVKSLMSTPLIIDGRNIYSPDTMKQKGFTYISTGRATVL